MTVSGTTTFGRLAADGYLTFGDGYRTRRDQLADDGYCVLRVADVQHGWISYAGTDFVAESFASQMGNKIAQDGDLLVTTKGTIGRIARVSGLAGRRVVYSPQLCYFRVADDAPIDRTYFAHWLSSPQAKTQIATYSGNTDMAPYLSLRDVAALEITLPPISTQRAIGEALKAINDKITINRRIVDGIRALASATIEQSVVGSTGVVRTVDEVATFHNRRRVPLSKKERLARSGTVPYYGATGIVDYVDEPIFTEPLVLVGEDGTVVTDSGRAVVQYVWGSTWVNNHAHVLTGNGVSTQLLRHLIARATVADRVTGAVQPKLSMGNLKAVEVLTPPEAFLGGLEARIVMLTRREVSAGGENQRLAATRDELLPLLMSGRITVKDAERRVEEET